MSEMVCQLKVEGREGCECASCQQSHSQSVGRKWISGLWFAVGCITSPCCTPLVVPLPLALLVGTPFAAWASANIGWIYGALTLISVVSFAFALRQWVKRKEQ